MLTSLSMKLLAKDLAADAAREIVLLSKDKRFGTLTAIQMFVAQHSGLSYSWLQKFTQGVMNNPSVGNLDKVRLAIEAAKRKPAA